MHFRSFGMWPFFLFIDVNDMQFIDCTGSNWLHEIENHWKTVGGDVVEKSDGPRTKGREEICFAQIRICIYPGRVTWFTWEYIYTPGRGKSFFQAIIFRFYVNLRRMDGSHSWSCHHCQPLRQSVHGEHFRWPFLGAKRSWQRTLQFGDGILPKHVYKYII